MRATKEIRCLIDLFLYLASQKIDRTPCNLKHVSLDVVCKGHTACGVTETRKSSHHLTRTSGRPSDDVGSFKPGMAARPYDDVLKGMCHIIDDFEISRSFHKCLPPLSGAFRIGQVIN